ncbi:hypothetical protein [Hyphomicrobium sp.]|jgi:hypothetical protein|uniref:hypothetical protein n=1 Tax=Hyphomicrobium sp. TaxID=82 RepID=UPI002FDFCE16
MRTYLISYDLAKPHLIKHVVAQAIMAAGQSWARPLEQTWYVRSDESEEALEAKLTRILDSEDGLLIQRVKEEAVLTNTSIRWFKRRQAGVETGGDTNVIAFPMPKPATDEPELPFAEAC